MTATETVATETCIKDAAKRMIDRLPDDVTWEELEYHFHVRHGIERGLLDIKEGRVVSNEEICRKYGVEP